MFFANGHLEKAAVAVPMLFFFAWQPGLFRGEAVVPKRTYILYATATLLSILDFVASWNWGLQYQGIYYTRAVWALNVAWIGLLGLALERAWRGLSSFKFNLFLHWMLFAWLGWYAFPYLGELP